MSPETPTPDAFSMLRDLIALATDPAACRTRLAKLQKLLEQTAAAEQRLAERSAAFDQKVATEKASLDERKAALDARAHALISREALAEKILEREKSDRRDRYQPMADGMTIVREPT
jgi:hypothetical protein